MIKNLSKVELRKGIFWSEDKKHIHIGFFVDDWPYYTVYTTSELEEYDIKSRKSYETVAIDKFINVDCKGILSQELKENGIEVYYNKTKLV